MGNTDSEHAFCWIMQELAKSHAGVPSVEELTLTLSELAPRIARHGTFNFMLSNGQALWAHASTNLWYMERRHPSLTAELSDEDLSIDFAQHTTPNDRVAVVVTAPLTTNETWTAVRARRAGGVRGRRSSSSADAADPESNVAGRRARAKVPVECRWGQKIIMVLICYSQTEPPCPSVRFPLRPIALATTLALQALVRIGTDHPAPQSTAPAPCPR